jgi:hypothetical protein
MTAMTPFFTRFQDIAFQEMRTVFVQGRSDIPDGDYGFLELYCDEPECDCRRVMIDVVSRTTGSKIWATINYGWENPEYYATWMGDREDAKGLSGAMLDPLNPQTQYSLAFLRLFEHIAQDQAYVDRLKRHYQMFKAELKRETEERQVRQKKSGRSRKSHTSFQQRLQRRKQT